MEIIIPHKRFDNTIAYIAYIVRLSSVYKRVSEHMGDRKSVHSGATATHDRNFIRVVYDAELKDLPICLSLFILICGCAVLDKKRSYLKLRENSVESNISFAPCCGFCSGPDWTNVDHFDRSPYSEECHWIYPWICCFSCEKPKFEVVDNAYMCKFV
jgi:hypothetical protein